MSSPARTGASRATATPSAPPVGWEFEVPKYRVSRDLEPAEETRFRYEPPFFPKLADNDRWQYGHRPLKAGELIATGFWPHPSMRPVNESARRVLEFFNSHLKHGFGLRWRPWLEDRVVLNDGLTRSMQPKISINDTGDAA